LICQLTGMEVSNASMYDAGRRWQKPVMLACEASKRKQILIPDTIHPSMQKY
jgi:glycine dehydrogenase subunit 1